MNADGERLEEDVESCAETSDPESNEEKDKEPDDAPQQVTAAVSSSAVAFACHFSFLHKHNKHFFLFVFKQKKNKHVATQSGYSVQLFINCLGSFLFFLSLVYYPTSVGVASQLRGKK